MQPTPTRTTSARAAARPPHHESGQSVVEFAVIVPVLLLLVVAIADFGRLYTSAVAIESAAREAADFGAFTGTNWTAVNVPTTVADMEHRACTAAAGSHLEGYATSDPDNRTCTNPSFTCTLERGGSAVPCSSSGGMVAGIDCSDPATEPPCTVHVRLDYDFRAILGLAPLPDVISLGRDSRFRVSNLTPP